MLFVVSFLGLFLEVALIRWIPANVFSLAYFSNIVLMAAFLGFGLGCLRARRDAWRMGRFPLYLLAHLALVVSLKYFEVVLPDRADGWIWSQYAGNRLARPVFRMGLLPALAVIFAATALLFVPIGAKVGGLMAAMRPLRAYAINVGGSLLGILAFTGLSLARLGEVPPSAWFACVGILALVFVPRHAKGLVVGFSALAATVVLVHGVSKGQTWSPYYSIQVEPHAHGSFSLYVNNFFHQRALNFDEGTPMLEKYRLPYTLKHPESLLVLGAGTGNDVAVALREGVGRIDAVEIDPAIIRLGRQGHPNAPYAQENVRVIVDDARSYLRRTDEHYDMIVFGTLDSHALLSGLSTVRLDNFVYTQESLRDAVQRLTPGGVVVLTFSVSNPWLGDKLVGLARSVFKDPPPLIYAGSSDLFNLVVVAGPGVRGATPVALRELAPFDVPEAATSSVTIPSDDWPYLYLNGRGIPGHYVKAVMLLVVLSFLLIVASSPGRLRSIDPPFFCLGAAFMLLETKSVTTLSLLFGTTWIVNGFVFAAILAMILLANAVAARARLDRPTPLFLALAVSLALNVLVPAGAYLEEGFWPRSILAPLQVALPLFFAGLVFARRFRETREADAAFASNLIGAVLGGFLEYASMAVGLNALNLLAGVFYGLAYLHIARRGWS